MRCCGHRLLNLARASLKGVRPMYCTKPFPHLKCSVHDYGFLHLPFPFLPIYLAQISHGRLNESRRSTSSFVVLTSFFTIPSTTITTVLSYRLLYPRHGVEAGHRR
jgi:hypothetical protein